MQDGRVLVMGGRTPIHDHYLASAETYDPTTGLWTTTGSMSISRYRGTATVLDDGQVLVAGGWNETEIFLSLGLFTKH